MAAIRTRSGMMMTNKYFLFPDSPHRHKSRSARGPTSAGDSEDRQWTRGTIILSPAFWNMNHHFYCGVQCVTLVFFISTKMCVLIFALSDTLVRVLRSPGGPRDQAGGGQAGQEAGRPRLHRDLRPHRRRGAGGLRGRGPRAGAAEARLLCHCLNKHI